MTLGLLLALLVGQARAEGFYRPGKLPPEEALSQAVIDRALQASFVFTVVEGSECSAQFISRKGYFLTAAHCVYPDADLRGKGSQQGYTLIDDLKMKVTDRYEFGRWFDVADQVPQYVTLKLGAIAERGNIVLDRSVPAIDANGFYTGKPEVVLMGRGFLSPMPTALGADGGPPSFSDELWDTYFRHSEDFVILKMKLPDDAPVTCMPLARRATQQGARLWGVGFPKATPVEWGLDLKGEGAYITTGYVRPMSKELDFPDPDFKEVSAEFLNQMSTRLQDPKVAFHTTNPAYKRSSGSMLVNKEGAVEGFTHLGHVVSIGSWAVRASYIAEQVNKLLPAEIAKDVLDCP